MELLDRAGWLTYQTAMASGLAAAAPFLLLRRGAHYGQTLPGRLGLRRPERPFPLGALWIHAVSVGEVAVAATLARELPKDLPILVTTVTPTGQERARATFLDDDASLAARAVDYLPFDLGPSLRSFLDHYRPGGLVLVEGDYWPLLLREAGRRNLPVAVINGRMGNTSARRLRRFPALSRRLFFNPVSAFGVQTPEDRRRLLAAGAEDRRIQVTGNLKFDSPAPPRNEALESFVSQLAAGRRVWVAGSTMPGEEEQVLDAYRGAGGGNRALLILAPRHPERWEPVARLIGEQGFHGVRRSSADAGPPDRLPVEVLLLDTLGELAALYAAADAAFIGGTLVPTGGHNPLEPAAFGVPTVVGPSMENFADMARRFDEADAWRRARDAGELARAWADWSADPDPARQVGERGRELRRANRGAVRRSIELLAPLLEQVRGASESAAP